MYKLIQNTTTTLIPYALETPICKSDLMSSPERTEKKRSKTKKYHCLS